MVVSLKANKTRIIAFLVLAVVVVGACVFLWKGKGGETEVKEYTAATNEERVAFLQGFGWQVVTEPAETREVMIPAQFNDVYTAYNVMQKSQGFDLKPYAGEVCTQYKYKIDNYPNEPEVYATLLVYGGKIIGGDVACAEADGFMHGFAPDSARYGETAEGPSSRTESSMSASSAPVSSAPESSTAASSAAESTAGEAVSSMAESSAADAAAESQMESAPAESTAADAIPEDAYPTD